VGAGWLGAARHDHDVVGSTNDEAVALARAGAVHGTVVTARAQTAGRGRGGHRWFSPPADNLYLSCVLRPALAPARVPPVTLAAGVALVDAVNALGLCASLKWPNDLLVHGRKVAGILTEMSTRERAVEHVVLGIGVNINGVDFPAELEKTASSLRLALGDRRVDRERFLVLLLGRLEPWLDKFFAGGVAAIGDAWRDRADFAGRRVRADLGDRVIEGLACGIDDDGVLAVRDDRGRRHRILAGDVVVL
jgi:BirA family biotin operon repressor/biotin-[acetyl-CoA-carboxylase] ligase